MRLVYRGVLLSEEIEALVAVVVLFFGFRQLLKFLHANLRGFNLGDKLQIASVGSQQRLSQGRQAVDGLLHWCPPGRGSAVPMMYLAVVLEEGNVVGSSFDAQDDVELVVHLDCDRPHLMLEAGTEPANVEAVAHLSLVVAVQFASQEGGNILRLDGQDQGFQKMRVEGLQRCLALEDQVSGVLGLHDAPGVLQPQFRNDRAVLLSIAIQDGVQSLDVELGCQLIGQVEVLDLEKGVVP